MNKKGFVFVETIVVLAVTMTVLLGLYDSYIIILNNLKTKNYYNNINDIYKASIIKKKKHNYVSSEDYYKCSDIEESATYIDEMSYSFGGTSVKYKRTLKYMIILPKKFKESDIGTNECNTITFKKYIGTLSKSKPHLVVIVIDEKNKRHYASVPVEES